ncbi:MAG: hypothetical protein AAFN93_28780, partial [Bacteroidota bacterium]
PFSFAHGQDEVAFSQHLVSEGEWSGKQQVFYDLFRVDNGQLVEHWDVIQEIPTDGLANNNTMFNF